MNFIVKVAIIQYLRQLRKDERQKPILERRRIPVGKDFAEAAGVSLAAYYRWARNTEAGINRKLIGAAIGLLRHCEFDTTFNDILEYDQKRESK